MPTPQAAAGQEQEQEAWPDFQGGSELDDDGDDQVGAPARQELKNNLTDSGPIVPAD